ncbi:hypothetical protein Awo_c34200 [Acetobacterium woodii DSM 1030]|uniref:Uncharacterized protein n=1 Tax=Acetobacterium woodii (strain ATCC 29683 / DSM 1030 / JCM 2381 / KCTC 1655 / WB1) TaxID=931626 RepID=H6LBM3_ACEWD|nr:hypothetical protein Awo_c34200 [Acetobacterium woodii DSM 1030]
MGVFFDKICSLFTHKLQYPFVCNLDFIPPQLANIRGYSFINRFHNFAFNKFDLFVSNV